MSKFNLSQLPKIDRRFFDVLTPEEVAGVRDALKVADYKPVSWMNVTNCITEGCRLKKNAGGSAFNAGASSYEKIATSGRVRLVPTTNGGSRFFGLSYADTDTNFNSINFCFDLDENGNNLLIYESGAQIGTNYGVWTIGTVLEIERIGLVINYIKDGAIVHSSVCTSAAVIADTAIYYQNAAFEVLEIKGS